MDVPSFFPDDIQSPGQHELEPSNDVSHMYAKIHAGGEGPRAQGLIWSLQGLWKLLLIVLERPGIEVQGVLI